MLKLDRAVALSIRVHMYCRPLTTRSELGERTAGPGMGGSGAEGLLLLDPKYDRVQEVDEQLRTAPTVSYLPFTRWMMFPCYSTAFQMKSLGPLR